MRLPPLARLTPSESGRLYEYSLKVYPIYEQLCKRHAIPGGNGSTSGSELVEDHRNSSSGTNQRGANVGGTLGAGKVGSWGLRGAPDPRHVPLVCFEVQAREDDSSGSECESDGEEFFMAIHRAIAAKYPSSIHGSIVNHHEQEKTMALNEKISRWREAVV